jgi:quercetin dioxygenase-like cupin family protein
MRFFQRSHDGGKDSGVTGYFLIEIKSLFSIVLLRFSKGTREAYHDHAFNAFTIWLKGNVIEHALNGGRQLWKGGQFKYTPRNCFHKIEALETTWALTFRGPWAKTWREYKEAMLITYSHGRKIVKVES